jgi:uncharacterized protein YjiS (DUF1127 family)
MAGSGKRRKTKTRFPFVIPRPLEIAGRFPHSPQRRPRLPLSKNTNQTKERSSRFALARFSLLQAHSSIRKCYVARLKVPPIKTARSGYNRSVRELRALSPEQLRRAERRLLNPEPGSRAAAARDLGLDLALLAEQLRLTPEERAWQMLELCQQAEQLRGRALRTRHETRCTDDSSPR